MKLYDDKFAQLEALRRFPIPKSVVVSCLDELLDANIEFPAIQKAAAGASGRGVRLAQSENQLRFPCLLQEYFANLDGDYRITIIGDRAFAFFRCVRPGDFRASGSGLFRSLSEVPLEPASIAHRICQDFGFLTLATDWIQVDSRWLLLEISYTYQLFDKKRFGDHSTSKTKVVIANVNLVDGSVLSGLPNCADLIVQEVVNRYL